MKQVRLVVKCSCGETLGEKVIASVSANDEVRQFEQWAYPLLDCHYAEHSQPPAPSYFEAHRLKVFQFPAES